MAAKIASPPLLGRGALVVGIGLAALLLSALVAVLVLQARKPDDPRYRHAVVAANGYECASIGRRILEKGGSAADSAIAMLFCEGISCAHNMGLGGGFIATIYDASTGQVKVLNAKARAPALTTPDMFDNKSTVAGGLAMAVPGELRGYGELHRVYGKLPWADLVKPTTDLCRNGHRVTKDMARVLNLYCDIIKTEPSMSELYVNPETGDIWKNGDIFTEPTMAKTLDIIAEEGPEAIHNGSLTSPFVRDIQSHGGIITEEDLKNFRPVWQDPIITELSGGHILYSNPLPGSGSVLAFIINMLQGWVGLKTAVGTDSYLYWHRVIETFKFAYAKRTWLGDPSRSGLPFDIHEVERNLSDPSWAKSYRTMVDDARTYQEWRHYGALYEGADDHGTAQVVVVAPDGSVVSATSTINYIWGCQRRSTSLGIMLNNEMDDFAIPNSPSAYGMPPSPANMLAPNLQPLSSMVPSIVMKNGTVQLVIGAAGGTKITAQVALSILSVILDRKKLCDVMNRPRLHHQLIPMEVEYEEDFNPGGAAAPFVGIGLAALLLGALVAVLVLQPRRPNEPRYLRAAVASNGYECAAIGRYILEKGGSAADAAIATLFCEGITCPQYMGLGGGFLATIYDASTGQVKVLNSKERAPGLTTPNMFDNESTVVGGLAVAVLGELRGYGELYRAYGKLPWADLVRPTADLCRNGHRVSEDMGRVLNAYSDIIKAEPSMREVYVNPQTSETWNIGDIFKEPTMAKTLDIIAEEGPEAIHNGSLTATLVRDIQRHGGIITEEDLKNYRPVWQDPIVTVLSGGHILFSNPLPGSGSVLAFILNMLQDWVGFDTNVGNDSYLYWHRVIETFKFAYAKRTGLGDPSHSGVPFSIYELERNLSDPSWAKAYRALVNDARTYQDWRHYGALYEGADDHGTAHVVVVAPDGSVVSATSSINYMWGSQRRSTSLGFILNNLMDDFAIPNRPHTYGMPPSPANMLAPNLQPLSSMVPSIVMKNGTVQLVIGAAGSTKITTQVAISILKVIVEHNALFDVINRPRLHHQLIPMEVEYEEDFNPEVIEFLKARGHVTTRRNRNDGFAAVVAAVRDADGYILPQTDKRIIGSVDGF